MATTAYYIFTDDPARYEVAEADIVTVVTTFRDWNAGSLTELQGEISITPVGGGGVLNTHARNIRQIDLSVNRFR